MSIDTIVHKSQMTMHLCLCSVIFAVSAMATDYHVDAERGDDSNDGLTSGAPWRTIERAGRQRLGAGDSLLLKAGCVWRLERPFQVVTAGSGNAKAIIARYGEGCAPELRASLDGLAMEWQRESDSLWSAACGGPDIGNIVWEEGCGFKRPRLADVKGDGDFFHDKSRKRLFLRWPEDPAQSFRRMEICRKIKILQVDGCRNLIIDGVSFAFTGAHAIRGLNINALTVRNCKFGWIGGSFLSEPCERKTDGVRYGNGIEMWAKGDCRDIRIERNFFHDIYDTAMTNQGDGSGEMDGVCICSNRTERCEQSYEFWFRGGKYKAGKVEIFDNDFKDAGCGWSHLQRPNRDAAHVLAFDVDCMKPGRVVLWGNRFGRTMQCGVWLFGEGAKSWLEIGRNDWHESCKMRWLDGGKLRTEPLFTMRPAIEMLSPVHGETVAIVPEAQKKVISLPTLTDRIALLAKDRFGDKSIRHDKFWRKAAPLVLKWRREESLNGPWKIEIGKASNLADADVWYMRTGKTDEMSGRTGGTLSGESDEVSFLVPRANLESNREYFWRVSMRGRCGKFNCGPKCGCTESRRIVQSEIESFKTEDVSPRWIEIAGDVANIRDLGGWRTVDGKHVRQGLIYRGQALNDNSVTGERQGRNRLAVEDVRYMTNTLGIRTDLDLRSPGETADLSVSPLGESVNLVLHSSPCYTAIFKPNGKKLMAENFRLFCKRENYPIYMHCIGGADRTGSLAYVLLGVLGVDRHDMEVDWESTFYPNIPDENPDVNHWCRESHFNDGVSRYGEAGDGWNRRIELYLLDCGITEKEIAEIRAIMLESDPVEN